MMRFVDSDGMFHERLEASSAAACSLFSTVALVCGGIVWSLLCLVLVSKKRLFLGNTLLSIYCVLKEIKGLKKWAKDLKESNDEGEKHQICVFFALRSVCLQADIDNFMASQTCDFSNEAL